MNRGSAVRALAQSFKLHNPSLGFTRLLGDKLTVSWVGYSRSKISSARALSETPQRESSFALMLYKPRCADRWRLSLALGGREHSGLFEFNRTGHRPARWGQQIINDYGDLLSRQIGLRRPMSAHRLQVEDYVFDLYLTSIW